MDLAHLIRITVFTMMLLVTVPTLVTCARKPCSKAAVGSEFYLGSVIEGAYARLHVIAEENGTVIVSAPGQNYSRRYDVNNGETTISPPSHFGYNITKRATRIQSTVDISIVLQLSADASYDGLVLLPSSVLATEYLIPSMPRHLSQMYDSIVIVGTKHATKLEIAYPEIGRLHTNIELDEYDIYNFSSSNDLSGVMITSNYPIAVFVGTYTINEISHYHHNINITKVIGAQQVVPTSAWGYTYITPAFRPTSSCCLRAFASQDDTYIQTLVSSYPGNVVLNRGHFADSDFYSDSFVLTSNKPVMLIYHDSNSHFMTDVPAISQYMNSYYFYVTAVNPYIQNYLAIIVPAYYKGGITFSNKQIPVPQQTSSVVVNNVQYVIAKYQLQETGLLHVFHSSQSVTFGAVVYGETPTSLSSYQFYNYAYPAGLMLSLPGCSFPNASTPSAASLVTNSIPPFTSHATVCFACQDMSSLVYCNNVQRCNQNQECYVEKHVTSGGQVKYSSGCSYTNMCHQHSKRDNSCRQCCTGSYCNNVGCGDMSKPARDHRGPFCYDCQHVGKVEDCHSVRLCRSDQVCNIERKSWGDSFSHYTLSCQDMRCLHSNQTIIGIGKRLVQDCQQCCSDDFCNTHCSQVLPNPGAIFG